MHGYCEHARPVRRLLLVYRLDSGNLEEERAVRERSASAFKFTYELLSAGVTTLK